MSENIRNLSLPENYDFAFLKPIFIRSLLICLLVWSFMIFQFWWGNHDWGYLKNKLFLNDGFFEARYSQHLFSVLFFDGNVLPVLSFVGAICFLICMGVLLAIYMELPKRKSVFYIFVLVIGLNPYIFVFFYYVYLTLPFMAWPLVGVSGLLLCEYKQNWRYFLFGSIIWFLLLGSYPPNVALILTIFTARRIICFCFKNEDFKSLIKKYVLLGTQFVLAFLGFEIIYKILEQKKLLNLGMYNLQMYSISEIFAHIPQEMVNSVKQLFNVQTFLEWDYCILLSIPIGFAVFFLCYECHKNRLILCLLLIGLFLCSRFAFLVAERSGEAFFRMEYFGRLGLVVFALGVIGRINKRWMQNLYLLWGMIVLSLFIVKDFEIQKVQSLGFAAGRKYQARLVDKIVLHPKFEVKEKYIGYSFGFPNFRERFYNDKYKTGEMLEYIMVFHHYIISGLFWEDDINLEAIGAGINNKQMLRVDHSKGGPYWVNRNYWQNNPENMKNIRYWIYMEAKQDSVYIDDKYIILVLNMLDFYQNRELVANTLDE